MSKSVTVFVVVREDRHHDDEITVHAKYALAEAAVEEFMGRYSHPDGRYRWMERDYGRPLWIRYVDCDGLDDGPKVRIERTEMEAEA